MSVNSLDPSEGILPIERFPQEDEGLISGEQKTSSSRTWKVLTASVFIGSCTSLVISSVYLRSVFIQFIKKCSQLPRFSYEMIECRDSFNFPMNSWKFTLIVSTIALGYLCQKSWEFTTREKQEIINERVPLQVRSTWSNYFHKFKYAIASAQVRFGYEANIVLGYLYNGLWIDTKDSPSWKMYFACQMAAIGLGGTFLGMYLRIQQYNLKRAYSTLHLSIPPPSLKKDWKEYLISSLALAFFVSRFFWGNRMPIEMLNGVFYKFISSASILLITRSVGKVFSKWIESKKVVNPMNWKEKIVSCVSASIFQHSPLVLTGWFFYMHSFNWVDSLLNLGLIGVAMGIQETHYVPYDYQQAEKKMQTQAKKNRSCIGKIACFAKNYWMTMVLVSGTATLMFTKMLQCKNLELYICPFSFELAENYVYFDGKGLSRAFIVGLSAFYARKIFKWIHQTKEKTFKRTSRFFLDIMDKYQFDCISLIPLAIISSGKFNMKYSGFVCYNPYLVISLLGYTFGVYKEQIKSRTGAQILPGFTNVGVMITPL